MDGQVIKEIKNCTDCTEIIHLKKDEQKPQSCLHHHTNFIKQEIKAEKLDHNHEYIYAVSSMKFPDFNKSLFKNDENNISKLSLSNIENFFEEESQDIRCKNESFSRCLNTAVQFQSFLCVLCNENQITYQNLKSHIKHHLNENEIIKESNYQEKLLQCQMCDYTTSRKQHLKRHIDSIHNQLKPHKCPM